MVLANLLPCELNFYIKGTSIKGSLKPGKEAVLHAADTSQNMELGTAARCPFILRSVPCLTSTTCVPQGSCWRTVLCVKSCSSHPGPKTTWSE